MAFVNPATAVTVGAVDSHHLLGLYRATELIHTPNIESSAFKFPIAWIPMVTAISPVGKDRLWKEQRLSMLPAWSGLRSGLWSSWLRAPCSR